MRFILLKGIFVLFLATIAQSSTVPNKPQVESDVEQPVAPQKMEARPQMVIKEVVVPEKIEEVLKEEVSMSTMKKLKRLIGPDIAIAANVTSRLTVTVSCLGVNCGVGGSCVKGSCVCQANFSLLQGKCYQDLCKSTDAADFNPCNNAGDTGSRCVPDFMAGKYTCICSTGFVLQNGVCKDPCLGVNCGVGGSCVKGSCVCKASYSLLEGKCYQDLCKSTDAADSNPCNNAGDMESSCVPDYKASTYSCTCSRDFSPQDGVCKDACTSSDLIDSNPCNNEGDESATCQPFFSYFYCHCSDGTNLLGYICKNACVISDIDDSNPCNDNGDKGSACLPYYNSDYYDDNILDNYQCVCSVGFRFSDGSCIDPCFSMDAVDSNPCNNEGDSQSVCVRDYIANTYTCTCSIGFKSFNGVCKDACASGDKSDSNPCNNNGDLGSICHTNYYDGTYYCNCSSGWVVSGGSCINPCLGVDCGTGGSCVLGSCVCKANYSLHEGKCYQDACFSLDAADSNPCNNGGDLKSRCVPNYVATTYMCNCSVGFRFLDGVCKDGCASRDGSDSNPCNNNGDLGSKCIPNYSNGSYNCNC